MHVDDVKVGGEGGLAAKDLADALDTVRGRAMAIASGRPSWPSFGDMSKLATIGDL
ncbi:hypothetical protein [Actinomadura verrucosospora]|uniref:hypothetical protein n=1 Tax=Actinomadura verrucosospora TaxID=46165 RepID=UPI0015671A7E|nr:hypothetical protein [Actinomadura verrucosospora]